MRMLLVGIVVGGVLGAVAGFAGGIFIYPFWFLTDVATEEVADRAAKTAVARGAFVHANPSDPIHWGKGHVSVLADRSGRREIHLESDFEVGPGPAYRIYLASAESVRSKEDFQSSDVVELGRLRAFKGSQIYPIPADVTLDAYKSVVIWCEEFSVLISPATLSAGRG